jgi:hypothetical protein
VIPLVFRYAGRSRFENGALTLSPNLARKPVSFDAALVWPLRFREAISALHDVVISDLRFEKKDRTAYREYLAKQVEERKRLRQVALATAREEQEVARMSMPPDLPAQFKAAHRKYWAARHAYVETQRLDDPWFWRRVMLCDPVITVANDVVFFECFSADESSYGCLTVERDAFRAASGVQCGTTNVDYSQRLYEHFQELRTYRPARFTVDPSGFTAKIAESSLKEEKVDLPESWLRGFLQLQAAMNLPSRKVRLSREAVYSLLAYLKRHKAKLSPRALRFELRGGRPPVIILEPWEQSVVSAGTVWDGPDLNIRAWGRQRLLVLARLLPLADSFDVHLLGDGLPTFWIARMGEMRLTLGLSGWTTNDWTRASALDLMAPTADVGGATVKAFADALEARQKMSLTEFSAVAPGASAGSGANPDFVRTALYRLARLGQTIHDLDAGVQRWRRVMPPEVAMEAVVAEHPEVAASRGLREKLTKDESLPSGLRVLAGASGVEALLDKDGVFKRAKCSCSHFFTGGLRKGPCRHLIALREAALKR